MHGRGNGEVRKREGWRGEIRRRGEQGRREVGVVTHEVMVSNFREKGKGKCNFLVGEFGRTGAGQDILLSDKW